MKYKVNANSPASIQDINDGVREAIEDIEPAILENFHEKYMVL